MPKKSSGRKLEDLGEKLDFLEGILGHRRPAKDFQNSTIAEVIYSDPSQVTRKRSGREPITNSELAKLIDFYELAHQFDFELFFLPFSDFKEALKNQEVGTYAGSSGATARAELIRIAHRDIEGISSPRGGSKDRLFVQIRLVSSASRAGGLGYGEPNVTPPHSLRNGDRVFLDVGVPGDGHLVILNDQLGVELTCLMPSMFAPDTVVNKGRFRVPTSIDFPFFDVTGPPGKFRLFAIWTDVAVAIPWDHSGSTREVSDPVSPKDLSRFVEAVRKLDRSKADVCLLDYIVM